MEASVHNKLAEVEGLRAVTEGGLVRRSWVDGAEERMWKHSLRIRLRCYYNKKPNQREASEECTDMQSL